MNASIKLLALVGAMTALTACLKEAEPCTDNGQCAEGEACIEGSCEAADCLDSSACGVGEYCDPTLFTCTVGCEQDADCLAGWACDSGTNTCEELGCRNTTLDCPVGTFCDVVTGECYTDGRDYCETCNGNNLYDCGGDAYCIPWEENRPSEGNCYYFCQSDADCPGGFTCAVPGWPYENYCLANCPLLVENGYL